MAVDCNQQVLKKGDVRELHVLVKRLEGGNALVQIAPAEPAGHAANMYRPHFQVRPIDLLRLNGAGATLAVGEICAARVVVTDADNRGDDKLNVVVKVQTPLGQDAAFPVGGLKICGHHLRPGMTLLASPAPEANPPAESAPVKESAPAFEIGGASADDHDAA